MNDGGGSSDLVISMVRRQARLSSEAQLLALWPLLTENTQPPFEHTKNKAAEVHGSIPTKTRQKYMVTLLIRTPFPP